MNGHPDVNGLILHLDHIADARHRPLDALLFDHFMQGVLKHLKSPEEPAWTWIDWDNTFGEGDFDLTQPKLWQTRQGKAALEALLADRLFEHRIGMESAS